MTEPQPQETPECILVVDDAPSLLDNLSEALYESGYQVLSAADGLSALQILSAHHVDLVVADIAMPQLNGYQLYERVRQNQRWVHIPFIFLTARTLDSDIRYGKELGADDYLVKPIQIEDLLAVVRGKLRRARQLEQLVVPTAALEHTLLELGRLHIDLGQHRVWMDEQPIDLSVREFTLLECLARVEGQVVPVLRLLQATHQLEVDTLEAGALLRPLIRSVRRKLGYAVGEMGCIENVRGVGYRLIAPR
jgi:DNA-binding response OmpR family regulator